MSANVGPADGGSDDGGGGREDHDAQLKIVVLGDASVGKTSLVSRYLRKVFNEKEEPTCRISFVTKKLFIDGKKIKLCIWDTAGQEKYRSIGPLYYRNAHGAIVVFDLTQEKCLEVTKFWVKQLRSQCSGDLVITLAGNKSDLADLATVTEEECNEVAKEMGATYVPTSALTGDNVSYLFEATARKLVKNIDFDELRKRRAGEGTGPSAAGAEEQQCAC